MDKKDTFIAAVKANEGLLYKLASIYTNTVEDRNDLMQEIVYQLWKSFDSFNQRSGISTWMYRVAMNVALYHLKAAKRKIVTVPLDAQPIELHDADNNGLEEKLQLFKEHLNNLNLLDKGIVLLYLEDKSYDEIAQITGISTTNVGTKIARIKEKLKNQIAKHL